MKVIEFSEHFDKLNKMEWTSIRKYNEENVSKYANIGDIFEVIIKGKPSGLAVLKDKKLCFGNNINFDILVDDIMRNGKIDWDWYWKIKEMPKCLILYFEVLVPTEAVK